MSKRTNKRTRLIGGVVAVVAVVAFVSVATLQARAVGRIADGIRPGMTVSEVLRHAEGWRMLNTHPVGRGTQNRAAPGPEYFGYSGDVYVLTPVLADGRETDLRKLSRAEFEQRLEKLLSDGEPWSVYFSYRTVPTSRGILVRFDGKGRVAR